METKSLLKTHEKKKNISNYGRTVSHILFVVSEGLYFSNNNPQWEPVDIIVTLLICGRE